ncbi:MAG: hypothetical protein J3T61_08785, partial [Candidatus Brocadiales bacterium]|nr:hypothetical protein [Candidatus Bathyanammoxibius sp.]
MKKTSKSDVNRFNRRDFIKAGALLGTGALLAYQAARVETAHASWSWLGTAQGYPMAKPENIVYSTCLQCHTACPIKVSVIDGILVNINGNPYSPQSMLPHIPYENSPLAVGQLDGYICPKGQAGIQSLYDPY